MEPQQNCYIRKLVFTLQGSSTSAIKASGSTVDRKGTAEKMNSDDGRRGFLNSFRARKRRRWRHFPALLLAFTVAACGTSPAESDAEQSPRARQERPEAEHFTLLPQDIKWITPPPAAAFLPDGVLLAFIEGGPPNLPVPYTFRLKFPAGSRLMPHTHPTIEKLTVISGTLHQGVGDVFDQAASEAVPAGGFSYRAPGIPHFVWFDEETVLQFSGNGPFGLEYVNPADDPRNQAE